MQLTYCLRSEAVQAIPPGNEDVLPTTLEHTTAACVFSQKYLNARGNAPF